MEEKLYFKIAILLAVFFVLTALLGRFGLFLLASFTFCFTILEIYNTFFKKSNQKQ